MKPISTGLPTMGSDVNEEHDMDRKPVLPVRLKVDALPLLGCNSSFFVLGINIIRILFLDSWIVNLAGATLVNSS